MKKYIYTILLIISIFISYSCRDSDITASIGNVSSDSIELSVNELCSFKTRFFLAENEHDIAIHIAKLLETISVDTVIIDSFINTAKYPLESGNMVTDTHYNVYGIIRGTGSSGTGVIGAHFDSYSHEKPLQRAPGADNNASGIACILEIARVMVSENIRFEHDMLFALFGAEEFMTMYAEGHSGAGHFAANTDRDILFMIDCNQIGYNPQHLLLKTDFQVCPGSQMFTSVMLRACTTYTDIKPVLTGDHIYYSDVYYFWKEGIPSILFEEYFFSPNNFTSLDVPDSLNYELITQTARFILAGLMMISSVP